MSEVAKYPIEQNENSFSTSRWQSTE